MLPPTNPVGDASARMFFLVTGASGVGKTSVCMPIETEAAETCRGLCGGSSISPCSPPHGAYHARDPKARKACQV